MRATLSVFSLCTLIACSEAPPAPIGAADLVLVNGRVITMAGATPDDAREAEALCIKGDTITFVGSRRAAEACAGPETRMIDVGGRTVLPGLIDSHMHSFGGAITDTGVNLSKADTPEKFSAALAALKLEQPGDGVLYARGWQNHLFDPQGPRAAMLDAVFGDRPVILGSVDGHSTVFSSAALSAAGVDASTPDPEPGFSFFERDAETGALLGTARERASGLVTSKLIERKQQDYRDAILRWLPRAAAAGLTGLFDAGMGAPTEEEAYELLADLEAEGLLSLRVFTSAMDRGGEDRPARRLLAYRNRYASELIQPVAIKVFADGVPEGHTAFLSDDYADRPGFRGVPATPPARLQAVVDHAAGEGVAVHVHAIGGAAVEMTLDAFESAPALPTGSPRHGIGHMDLVDRDDIARFAALDVIAQTSIHWATCDPSFVNLSRFVGENVMEAAYPVKSLMASGAVQSFGTDWPASPYLSTYLPFDMIEVAVTRRLPGRLDLRARGGDEAISRRQAIWGMTRASAYQLGRADDLGSLEVGKRADLIVLSQDVLAVEAATIHKTTSLLTVVAGRVVHEQAALF